MTSVKIYNEKRTISPIKLTIRSMLLQFISIISEETSIIDILFQCNPHTNSYIPDAWASLSTKVYMFKCTKQDLVFNVAVSS